MNYSINLSKTLGSKNKCWYCGEEGRTTKDHFYPKCKGGRLMVYSCPRCNLEKSDMTPKQWIKYLDSLIYRCENGFANCHRGKFIKTICPNECSEIGKLQRMKRASETLWDRIKNK